MLHLPAFREGPATTQVSSHLARMHPIHGDHGQPHDKRIEDVEEDLTGDDVPIIALGVFHDSYNGSYKDQDADQVQRDHVLLPRRVAAFRGRLSADTGVEDRSRNDEETEEDHLDHKTGNNDGVPGVGGFLGIGSCEKTGAYVIVLA